MRVHLLKINYERETELCLDFINLKLMFYGFVGYKSNIGSKTQNPFDFLISFNIKEITDKTHSNKKKPRSINYLRSQMTPMQHITTKVTLGKYKMWEGNKNQAEKSSTYIQLKPSVVVAAEERKKQSDILGHKILSSRSAKPGLFFFFARSVNTFHFFFLYSTKGRRMWDKSWMEHLVADVHVLLMAIVSAVNLGFSRPRRAIPLYRLGRQSRVVRILPGLPVLLAAIALFFLIIIPGDLSKRDRFMTCTVTPRCSV